MSIKKSRSLRRILPRWRLSAIASNSEEFSSFKPIPKSIVVPNNDLELTKNFFITDPNIGNAAELVASTLLVGNSVESTQAIEYILSNKTRSPKLIYELARSISERKSMPMLDDLNLNHTIANIRKLLILNPKNPMLWSDLARHHASLGKNKKAEKCITTALSLAPNHRWMLRTASRFFVHYDQSFTAHKILAKHILTKSDPWLISAELACAQVAGKAPHYWRQANDLLKHNNLKPLHFSELAIAVGMMELEAGNRKRAKSFVKQGLLSPTENSLAQVFWAQENRHLNDGFMLDEHVMKKNDAYEAETQLNKNEGYYLDAIISAEKWAEDEPFAGRPLAEICYLSCLVDDHEKTIKMANNFARTDSQGHLNLEMNKIYAHLSSNTLSINENPEEIETIKNRLIYLGQTKKSDAYHAIANLGLWHYRYGDKNVGREFYNTAIEHAEKTFQFEAATLAATFAAREAIIAKESDAFQILSRAKTLSKKYKSLDSEFYIRKLDDLIANVDDAKTILSPELANKYVNKKIISPKFRIERTSEATILWVPKKN